MRHEALFLSLALALLGEPIFAPFDAPFRALPLIKRNRRPNYTARAHRKRDDF
jgi:hypothetical protein